MYQAAAPYKATLSVGGDIATISNTSSPARAQFENSFKDDLAKTLVSVGLKGISAKDIKITGIRAGSIIVEYYILTKVTAFKNASEAMKKAPPPPFPHNHPAFHHRYMQSLTAGCHNVRRSLQKRLRVT
jgi:hypothetical protein